MWTPAARANFAREHLLYATSLTDAEWASVASLLSAPAVIGPPWRWSLREVLDVILYVLRTACAWRHLPRDLLPWSTVHLWFLRLARIGTFERLAHALAMTDREWVGRDANPTGAVVDAQAARSGVGVRGRRL